MVGDTRYQLTQFHFFPRPSEERIRGKVYDMVLHLMHESSDGKVAGVAVLLKAGAANATLERLWAHMLPRVLATTRIGVRKRRRPCNL